MRDSLRALLFLLVVCASLLAQPARAAEGSIYEFIEARIDPATGALPPEGVTLPDEPAARKYSRIRWVPGALEGLGTRHMKWDGSEKASRVARLLELIATGNDAAEEALYDLLRADDVVTFYTDALDFAASRIRDPEPELHAMARRFATESADRGPVKFGIAMLGSFGDERDVPTIQTLALHDEFGLYAAEALAEIASDRQRVLYEMARRVTGWGRVEAVSRMVATSDPTLRRWLLTEGYRNSASVQYVAYQCAAIADLAGALQDLPPKSKTADVPLLVGAADLIQEMIRPGPVAGFAKYDDAAVAARAFLQNIQKRRDSVSFYLAAVALRDYATGAVPVPSSDVAGGGGESAQWSDQEKQEVSALAARVINDSSWKSRVVAAVEDDASNLDQAEAAADKLGVKTFDLHLHRLARHSTNAHRWDLAFAAASPEDIKKLVDTAQATFRPRFADPKAHHTPASSSDGLTTPIQTPTAIELRTGDSLEAVLRGLARYPGSGLPIIESSLADADDRVRRAAVEALVRWGSAYLRGVSVRAALNTAARDEADETLKARMVALLNLATLP
jgi:hypothetical protein